MPNDSLGKIIIITPPSQLHNQNISFCLINTDDTIKDQFADQLNKNIPNRDINVYVWDDAQANGDYIWLLNACRAATYIIVDMKSIAGQLAVLSGYILILPNTYYFDQDNSASSLLNTNKLSSVEQLFNKINSGIVHD